MADAVKQVAERSGDDGVGAELIEGSSKGQHAHVRVFLGGEQEPAPDASKKKIKERLEEAKKDYEDFGGWRGLLSGHWLWLLIQKSFRDYWERANVEYFERKYGTQDKQKIAKKLIAVTASNAALLGAVIGAAVSVDEITALATLGEGGVGLPANVAIGALAIGSETILLVRFHLQLLANLGKLYGVPLDPDDPEDILTILAFAVGGISGGGGWEVRYAESGQQAGRTWAKEVFKKKEYWQR